MPCFDFKCDKCGAVMEFNTNKSLPASMKPPEDGICPKCHEGKIEQLFSPTGISFDIVGEGCYMNDYGKHAWKKNLSVKEQAEVLSGERDPY